jgi:hypothetical protein
MFNDPSNDNDSSYEIKVLGKIDHTWSDWFDGFSISTVDQNTILKGKAIDQAALLGLLNKIHGLGLVLISVIQVNRRKTDAT